MAQFGVGTLKVGKVTLKEPGVVSVEIDTTSGSLVTTREISTLSGGPAALLERCDEHEHGGPGRGPGPGHMGGLGLDGGVMRQGGMGGHIAGGFGGMGMADGGPSATI